MTDETSKLRGATLTTSGFEGMEGAGVRIRRLIMTDDVPMIDPFLMLDWFHSDTPQDYLAGFPDHPHRGFETVTYMLAGKMRHGDNKGNDGVVGPGDIQWMTAGAGIVHSEMPEQIDGLLSGFQLWVNLPAAHKMSAPRYQDVVAGDIPVDVREGQGASARVITGTTSTGISGPVSNVVTDPLYLDVHLDAGGTFEEPVAYGHQGFVMVHEGQVTLDGAEGASVVLERGQLAVLGPGDLVRLRAEEQPAKALLVAAQPINEPVVQGGPFVMNTREEVLQAFSDFRNGAM